MEAPSWVSLKLPKVLLWAGAITCTSCPARTRPAARRSANREAPFMSGGKVSQAITTLSGVKEPGACINLGTLPVDGGASGSKFTRPIEALDEALDGPWKASKPLKQL